MAKRVPRTRNGGTWTESQYWSAIRSALRAKFKWWKPMRAAKDKARRPYKGKNKRQKWEYQCASCKKWYTSKDTQIDHIIPCGSLKCYEDIVPFIQRMTVEDEDAFQVLCKPCHQKKTTREKEERKKNT